MSSSADCGGGDAKRHRVDGRAAGDAGVGAMNGTAAHHHHHQQQEGHSQAASASPPVCVGSGDVCGRLAAIHSLLQQSAADPLIMPSITNDQASVIAHEWSSVKSSVSTLSAAIQTMAHHISAAPPPPPGQPDTAVDVTANRLPSDVFCDGVVGYLPVDVAISPARATNTHYGTQLINEAFMLKRVDCSLDSNHLSGLIDVYRPSFQYYSKCAYVVEQGGHVWQEMADFICVAAIYKLIKALPLRLSADWMATMMASKSDFHQMPAALAIYSTFGHMLSYQGTSLELRQVDGDHDSDQESDEDEGSSDRDSDNGDEMNEDGGGGGDASAGEGTAGSDQGGQQGDGGVTEQRYRIRSTKFTTVPLTDLPPTHPYCSIYDAADPPVRCLGWLFRSFTAFVKWMVLRYWCRQEGMERRRVLYAYAGLDTTRYLSLLREPIDGHKTIDYMDWQPGQGDDGRERLIIVKGTTTTDTIVAYLWLSYGDISLLTTEAATEGNSDIERYPIAVNAARRVLVKYGLERTVLA
uniref:Uncharacterized protein n=1 Tax=Vitrella brassicaformis TaxID=1169539 RepID=A0A7S1P2S0_9ALVE|mmetsp:Transcript_27279/g.68051  ORF Transcript_27279/g.68051 Transcript_27279/m.68051 type:complete len:523 (+) Transcript_27279:191-1759(+)